MVALADAGGGSTASLGKLNNVLMQLRKCCNHPDLITSAFTNDPAFPPPDVLVAQCGKMALLHRLLNKLHAAGHKVLIFSQASRRQAGQKQVGEGRVMCGYVSLFYIIIRSKLRSFVHPPSFSKLRL
jgi:hypothetical protein